MKAMLLDRTVSLAQTTTPLRAAELPVPQVDAGEILIRVAACGVCHTELDEIEGRAKPSFFPIVLGHEVVGYVEQIGSGVTMHHVGDRVGVGWIHSSTGALDENLSGKFRATGRDAHGGYAQYMTVPGRYAYPIPNELSDAEAAPLLCAGAIGYRALKLTGLRDGQRLGLTGFGGSAHIVIQLVRHQFPNSSVYVFARSTEQRQFALQLGAIWAGDTTAQAPDPLHAIIDTTPAWAPVVYALANLRPAGRLVINAIRKENDDKEVLQQLSYHQHLWWEREIKSVANITHHDIREFLPLAGKYKLRPHVTTMPLDQANEALLKLRRGRVHGAIVLVP